MVMFFLKSCILCRSPPSSATIWISLPHVLVTVHGGAAWTRCRPTAWSLTRDTLPDTWASSERSESCLWAWLSTRDLFNVIFVKYLTASTKNHPQPTVPVIKRLVVFCNNAVVVLPGEIPVCPVQRRFIKPTHSHQLYREQRGPHSAGMTSLSLSICDSHSLGFMGTWVHTLLYFHPVIPH